MSPTYRAWSKTEIETIYSVMAKYAPWRGKKPWEDPEFMASWLNNFQLIEQNTGHPTTEEELTLWWMSTDEFKNEWPKWEEPTEPTEPIEEPGPVANPIVGTLRVSGSGYADSNGPVLPIGLHLGDIFSKFTRDRDHAERYLDTAASAGYRIIQFWMNLGTLGGSYWAGREVGPGITPDFYGELGRFTDLLDKYKLKGVYNLGDYKLKVSHSELWSGVHSILNGKDIGAFMFGGNEAWQTGADSGNEVWNSMSPVHNMLTLKTTTAPPSEEKIEIAKWCRGDIYAIHGYRGGEDNDRIRHIFSIPWEGQPPKRYGYQDEPTGPGSAVSVKPSHCYNGRDVDANHMCALAFQSLMCNQAFNYFCSEGIKSDGDITQRAGFKEVPRVASMLPFDVMSWDNPIHFGASQASKRIFEPVSGNKVRFDHRIAPDGRFVGLLYGDEGHAIVQCARPCDIKLLNWNGTVAWERGMNHGEQISVDFTRSQGGQPGYTAMAVSGKLK